MDLRQAILPDTFRVKENLFPTDLCRDSVAMDGNVKLHKPTQRYEANLM